MNQKTKTWLMIAGIVILTALVALVAKNPQWLQGNFFMNGGEPAPSQNDIFYFPDVVAVNGDQNTIPLKVQQPQSAIQGVIFFFTYCPDHLQLIDTQESFAARHNVVAMWFPYPGGTADGCSVQTQSYNVIAYRDSGQPPIIGQEDGEIFGIKFQVAGSTGTEAHIGLANAQYYSPTNGLYAPNITPANNFHIVAPFNIDGNPPTYYVGPGGTIDFSSIVTGGVGQISYSLSQNESGGDINSQSGEYVAGMTTGTDVITVTDQGGHQATINVVVSTLQVASSKDWIDPEKNDTFVASGGATPYAYTFVQNSSGATLNSSTGAYSSGANAGIDIVKATDANNIVGSKEVNVVKIALSKSRPGNGITNRPTTITPADGTPPYTYEFVTNNSGAGAIGAGGIYTTGSVSKQNFNYQNNFDVIRAIDAHGNTAEITVPYNLLGDMNGANKIDFLDVVMAHQAYRGGQTNELGDMNGSGGPLNFMDVYTLYQLYRS